MQAQLAQLSQNPNDLERIMTAIVNVANSPMGQIIGQVLQTRMSGGSIEAGAADLPAADPAE